MPDRSRPVSLEEFLGAREALGPEALTAEEREGRGAWERKIQEIRDLRGEDAVRVFRSDRAGWLVGRYGERVVAWDDRNRDGRFQAGYLFDAALAGSRYARDRFRGTALATAIEDLGIDAVPSLAEAVFLHRGDVARGALDVIGTLLRLLGWLLIVPLYTFFFLMRLEDVWAAFVGYLPGAYRDRVLKVLLAIHHMLIGFFRGRVHHDSQTGRQTV